MTFENLSFFENCYLPSVKDALTKANVAYDDTKLREYCLSKYKERVIKLNNNVENKVYSITNSKLLDSLIIKKKYTITPFNTLFKPKSSAYSIIREILIELDILRKSYKDEMKKFMNVDAEKYTLNDIRQKVIKIIANSLYGCLGEKSFHFFNPFLGPSITSQGRNLISNAITSFEAFLSGNLYLETFDELVSYIQNILNEPLINDTILPGSEALNSDKVFNRIEQLIKYNISDSEKDFIVKILENCSQLELERLYYKNNLEEFLKIPEIIEFATTRFVISNFPNVNKVPSEIKDDLEFFNSLLDYYVSYSKPIDNKFEKAKRMDRNSCILTDTDSTFLTLKNWVETISKANNLIREDLDVETRCSIISVMTFVLTKFIDKCLGETTNNCNIEEDDRPRINMKSEFTFSRVILTRNKKNYAGVQLSREGIILDSPKLDLKGLSIRKVQTPKPVREFMANLLEEDILKARTINNIEVYKKFSEFENYVAKLLLDGNVTLTKTASVKATTAYKNPFSQQPYRGFLVWNELYPHSAMPPSSSVKVIPLKSFNRELFESHLLASEDKKQMLMNKLDDIVTMKVRDVCQPNDNNKNELDNTFLGKSREYVDCLCVPFNQVQIPEEFKNLVDVDFITNDIMSKGNILLESIGFTLVKSNKHRTVSNIINL